MQSHCMFVLVYPAFGPWTRCPVITKLRVCLMLLEDIALWFVLI